MQKTQVLTSFYSTLLGTTQPSTWHFSLSSIYPSNSTNLHHIDAPFSHTEIAESVLGMNMHASLGPDGFGPTFYRKFWPLVKSKLHDLFQNFHSLQIDLQSLNRSYMVLIPKNSDAHTADASRPIALQNCPIKAISYLLTNRLQRSIYSLVNPNQTGFISGRGIAENFVFAADILNCCHRRKAPTIVIKLDFRKAFDSVNWYSLLKILNHHGIPPRFVAWVELLL